MLYETKQAITEYIHNKKEYNRSQYGRGITAYCDDLLDALDTDKDVPINELEQELLNGASSWYEYSRSSGLCYNVLIAERLLTPSQFNSWSGNTSYFRGVDFLDMECDALYKAYLRIKRAYKQFGRF